MSDNQQEVPQDSEARARGLRMMDREQKNVATLVVIVFIGLAILATAVFIGATNYARVASTTHLSSFEQCMDQVSRTNTGNTATCKDFTNDRPKDK